MQPERLTSQIRDVAAAVGELLDNDVEVLSIHIGPGPLPATISVMPGSYTQRLQGAATRCDLTGEYRARLGQVELSWVVADTSRPVFGGPLASLNKSIRALDEELGRPA